MRCSGPPMPWISSVVYPNAWVKSSDVHVRLGAPSGSISTMKGKLRVSSRMARICWCESALIAAPSTSVRPSSVPCRGVEDTGLPLCCSAEASGHHDAPAGWHSFSRRQAVESERNVPNLPIPALAIGQADAADQVEAVQSERKAQDGAQGRA